MFKKREQNPEDVKTNDYGKNFVKEESKQNTILKGSKLTGDINVSYDLELSGDIEGNISSNQNANIVIQGVCKGNIKTKEGNVNIEGELSNGDIIAGGDVKITGKFNGGNVKAKGTIYINGEFNGQLESNEIVVGSEAKGKGALFYKEYISISKGAKVEIQISRIQEESKMVKKSTDMKVVSIETPIKDISGVK